MHTRIQHQNRFSANATWKEKIGVTSMLTASYDIVTYQAYVGFFVYVFSDHASHDMNFNDMYENGWHIHV